MNKKFLSISVLIFSTMVSGAIIGSALAQAQQNSFDSIQYPVKELGNCQNKQACKTYCDNSKNIDACLAFAEENNLMSPKELAMAKKFKEIGMVGPGGCDGKDACDAYCSDSNHMEECITFAQQNGLMSGKELEESQKVLSAIKKGIKPPACSGKEECDAYCFSSEHMEECMTFAIQAGLMPQEEKVNAQKMLEAIKQGIKPPACRGESECQEYCSQEANLEECIKFGEATGMMKPEDATMMRKTGGKGPGDCKSKQECEAFCNNPNNSEICFNFGKDNGLISAEDFQKMEQGKQQMQQALTQMPAEVASCLTSALGADTVEKLKNGTAMPSQTIGDQMGKCFQQFSPQGGMNQQGPNMMQQDPGPGGCQSPEECEAYCKNNPQECQNLGPQQQQSGQFVPKEGQQMMPFQSGPDCQDPSQCQPSQGQFYQPGQPGQPGQEGQSIQYQPGQMMPLQNQQGQTIQFQGGGQIIQGEPNQMMQQLQGQYPSASQDQTGQFFQLQSQLEQYQQYQQQPVMQQRYQQFIQQQPSQDMMQQPQFQQQPMMEPIQQPQPQPELQPQPESAPSTMNSNNLFGTLIKPFAKIFGF